MKILNLYAGIGGNRKLWGDEHQVTAIEFEPRIAEVYKDIFPNDQVIVTDAHRYLEEHYKEFDFIWSSPPCPSHSRIRKHTAVGRGQNKAIFPDMRLYEEIIFLQHYFDGKWVVENVIPYYKPLIEAQKIGRNLFWSNVDLSGYIENKKQHVDKQSDLQEVKGFDISKYHIGIRKDKILRNCVLPDIGKHVLERVIEQSKFNQSKE